MNLLVNGTLVEGPQTVTDSSLPSGTTTIPFFLNSGRGTPKNVLVSTGAKVQNVQSPSAFVALSGVGPTDTVTQAGTVYLRVNQGLFQARLTFNNPAGSPIVSVLPINGVLLLEPDAPDQFYCTKVEVQGSGVVEFYAAGLL